MDGEKWGWNSLNSKIAASLFQPRGLWVWQECSVLDPAQGAWEQLRSQTLEDVTDTTTKAHTKDGKTEIIMIYPSLMEGPIQVSSHVLTKWGPWSMCSAISKPLIKQINPINFKPNVEEKPSHSVKCSLSLWQLVSYIIAFPIPCNYRCYDRLSISYFLQLNYHDAENLEWEESISKPQQDLMLHQTEV